MADVAQHVLDKATLSKKWISDPEIRKSLDERLSQDISIYTMLETLLNADSAEKALAEIPDGEHDNSAGEGDEDGSLAELIARLITKVIKDRPPRFLSTIDDAIHIFKHLEISEELVEDLQVARELLVPIFSESYTQATRSVPSKRPVGWVDGILN